MVRSDVQINSGVTEIALLSALSIRGGKHVAVDAVFGDDISGSDVAGSG